jgi:hypothetical protein
MNTKPTKRTRKPVDKLSPSDFAVFPVWEYASDEEGEEGMDETWVRPVGSKHVPQRSMSQIVSAEFRTASGKTVSGFMVVSPLKSEFGVLDHCGGVILWARRYIPLTDPNGPALDFIKRHSLKALTTGMKMKSEEIFPLSFALRVPIEGEHVIRSGVIG